MFFRDVNLTAFQTMIKNVLLSGQWTFGGKRSNYHAVTFPIPIMYVTATYLYIYFIENCHKPFHKAGHPAVTKSIEMVIMCYEPFHASFLLLKEHVH